MSDYCSQYEGLWSRAYNADAVGYTCRVIAMRSRRLFIPFAATMAAMIAHLAFAHSLGTASRTKP